MEEATAGPSTTQSRGQKRSRPTKHEDDDKVLLEIRDSMHTNTELLSQLVATKPSSASARELFINFMADTLRLMDDAKYEETKNKIVPLLMEVTKPHEKTSGGMQKVHPGIPGTSKSAGASTTTSCSEMWQPHPQEWERQPPPAQMGVWGSASQEYMAKYHVAPYQPRCQQQQVQPPRQQCQQPYEQQSQEQSTEPEPLSNVLAAASSSLNLSMSGWSIPSNADQSMNLDTSLNTPPPPARDESPSPDTQVVVLEELRAPQKSPAVIKILKKGDDAD